MWTRVVMIWTTLRGDLRLLWRALRHPQCPGWVKLASAGLLLYLVLPIDIIPDVLPLIGVVDDVLIFGFGVKWLVRKLPASLRAQIGEV